MAMDLNRLNRLRNPDKVLEALQEYVSDLVTEFLAAPEGEAYLRHHPDWAESVGGWINVLLEFGYSYEAVLLPKMSARQVETILTQLFPRKLTLMDPSEADSAIPELTALWQFLQRQYRLKQSSAVLQVLQQVGPRFRTLMTDPSNFGIAKTFVTQGIAAGFDMTTSEGLQAFQAHANQELSAAQGSPLSAPHPAGEIRRAAKNPATEQLLIVDESGELQNSPASRQSPVPIGRDRGIQGILQLLLENGDLLGGSEEDLFSPSPNIRTGLLQPQPAGEPDLDPAAIALLQQQAITDTSPGTILQDFQALLDLVVSGVAVSSSTETLPPKALAELNQRMAKPIAIDLQRPVHKSYPNLHGLYLLLRASGMTEITLQRKQKVLRLKPALLDSWQQLNPSERYFTLLEAWLIRSNEEFWGDRPLFVNEGSRCLHYWFYEGRRLEQFSTYSEQQAVAYYPGFLNLCLAEMFGLMRVESLPPEPGKGWRFQRIQRLPLGDAVMRRVRRPYQEQGYAWAAEGNPTVPFGDLQPYFQPYFPDWKRNLATPTVVFQPGAYVFKVSLGKIWRRMVIDAEKRLDDLSGLILTSVEFDDDHLDMYRYRNSVGKIVEVQHPHAASSPSTKEVQIGELGLSPGMELQYIFDFGDWWEFDIVLEEIRQESRLQDSKILEIHGASPPQH